MATKERLLIFQHEIEVDRRLFKQSPIYILTRFLECFNSEGRQVFEVPEHVLEAMAGRLALVIGDEPTKNSFDAAFGGRIARQRDALTEGDSDNRINFDVYVEWAKAKKIPPAKRTGTPFEVAIEIVAQRHGMSEDNVRRKYKKYGRKVLKTKNG